MRLRKIDGEMNMQNCGYYTKLRKRRWQLMLQGWRQWQLQRTRAVVFRRDDTLSTSKHYRRWPCNPNGRLKFRKDRAYLPISRHNWRSATDGNVSCHGLALSFFEEMTRWQRQRYQRRWPRNPNIYLLLGHRHYDAIAHFFFPTITRSGFCSRLPKIISWRPWPQRKTEIYILKFFVDSIYSKTIVIIK